MESTRRRYLALIARAKDQSGTPEGDLCQAMAAKMLERHPALIDVDDTSLPEDVREYRYSKPYERELLIRVGEFLGTDAKAWTGSRSKVVVFVTDEPTHAAIEQAYETLRRRLEDVLCFAFEGFVIGALPCPPRNSGSKRDMDSPMPDQSLLDLAMQARNFGRASQTRKALPKGQSGR